MSSLLNFKQYELFFSVYQEKIYLKLYYLEDIKHFENNNFYINHQLYKNLYSSQFYININCYLFHYYYFTVFFNSHIISVLQSILISSLKFIIELGLGLELRIGLGLGFNLELVIL